MKAGAFIIHLARAHARAPQVERLKQTLPIPVTVLDAVDAEMLSEDEIARVYRPRLHKPRYPFLLRKTEVACFLSHRKAWQSVLDHGLDAGLVIEDDVELLPNFRELLNLALEHTGGTSFIRFPKQAREVGAVIAAAGGNRIFEPRSPGLGMQAQLVCRDAASELLAFTQSFDRPVDTTIQMRWLHRVHLLSSSPTPVREIAAALGGTTVQEKGKRLGEVLSREAKRTFYRTAVRLFDSKRIG